MTVYLLPGIGTDPRLFDRLDLAGLDMLRLAWPPFPAGCTLPGIAAELARHVDATRPHVLVGVSMGGMVAQELAVLTKPKKVVLISSWTGPAEWPPHMRWFLRLHAWGIIRPFLMWAFWPVKRVLGSRDPATDRVLYRMAQDQGADKIRHGAAAILRWKGSRWNGPLVRIHGDHDLVTPLRFQVDHLVPGGTHVMVLTRPAEVSAALRSALE